MRTEPCPWCKGTGSRIPHKQRLWNDESLRMMLADRQLMTLDAMAEKYGVSYQRLQTLLKKARAL